ncbi:MAG: aminopeptidase N [Proteobacteria bacterium]|nr:aminopeptidase N [Pseudomonadota bacterium]
MPADTPPAAGKPEAADKPKEIFLADYRPPAFAIRRVALDFDLREEAVTVKNRMEMRRRDESVVDLVLDGSDFFELVSVELDGEALGVGAYRVEGNKLVIPAVPASFALAIVTRMKPQENLALEGLYKTSGNYCTQCEAEGFRRITYYLDRPDVLAKFTVRIEADRALYPLLLSNGNLADEGEASDGRHWARWDDPFPKPSYLFALVAGDLATLEDSFTTCSGRQVALKIHAAAGDLDKCGHAMESLKKSMKWDEEVFGLEYDLDQYNIVAVADFNMGAMENKSLNVFNTKYVLARADTATDADFDAVQGVIAHEYFHNWTGNRVTCRDWFQLSLKEGLTVFRDEEFSSDMGSRAVKRIDDVRVLREHQFAEDAGPMAHPVRPESFIEINNFYTMTVYQKGAAVIRMMHRLLGPEGFRKGMDLYFQRHDGQAVTCDDFVAAMEDASGVDLGQFRLWYSQAGTPLLDVEGEYDAAAREYRLRVRQSCPATPGQPTKKPMHIPLAVGLLDGEGRDMELQAPEGGEKLAGDFVLHVKQPEQVFVFKDVISKPIPSLLRGFSAPVKLKSNLTRDNLIFLMAHDGDPFARWEAGQTVAGEIILGLVADIEEDRPLAMDAGLVGAIAALINDQDSDKALLAKALVLPSEIYLGQAMKVVPVDALHQARDYVRVELAKRLHDQWLALYRALSTNAAYALDGPEKARRALRNTALGYLMLGESEEARALAHNQLKTSDNMTDALAALSVITTSEDPGREEALEAFYDKWQGDPLVIDKWFTLQAASPRADTLNAVLGLTKHAAFTMKNPNRMRALVGGFSSINQVRFHDSGGGGYRFLADAVIELNGFNPQVAARMLGPLTRWRRFDHARQALMRSELERILAVERPSPDIYEMVSKSLK